MLETLSAALTPPHLQQTLSVFRWMFCILSVVAVFALCFHFAPYRVGHRTKMMLFPVLFGAGCLAILAYQATWQLAGYTRTEFVRFMERYNPRPDNAAHHLIRGTINDCHGVALAYTERDGSGRRVYPYDFSTAHIVGFRHPSEGLTGMENAADLSSDAGSLLLVGSTIGRPVAKAAVKWIPKLLPQAWRPFFTGGSIGGTLAAAGSAAPVADKITGFSTKAGERAGSYMRRALPWLQAVTPYAVATNYMAGTSYAQKANARLVGSKLAELPYTMDAHGPIARTIAKNALPAVMDSDTAHMMEQVLNEKASGTKQYAAEQLRRWKGVAGGAAAEAGMIVKGDVEEARRSAVSGTGRLPDRGAARTQGIVYNTNARRVPVYSGAQRLPESGGVVSQYPRTVYDRLPEQYRDEIKDVVEDPRVKRITDEVRRFYGPEANAMINRFQGRIPTVPRLFGKAHVNVAPYIAQTSFTNDTAGEAAKTLTQAELLRRDIKNKGHRLRTYPQRTVANIARDKSVETLSRMKQ